MSREEFIDATASDILKRIPVKYDMDKIKKKYGIDVSPTTVVLLQELERFNKLISTMFRSLSTLKRVIFCFAWRNILSILISSIYKLFQALKGEVGMSNELDDLAKSLYNGQLPTMWRRLAPATKKSLGNWMEHFFKRNDQYNKWVNLFNNFIN